MEYYIFIILIGSSTIDIIHGKEKYKTKLQITHYLWIFLSKLIKYIKLTSAYSKKLGYAFVDFVGLDMTAALSIFLKWQKMWNKGGEA
jgi:hypothetical protein